MKLSTSRPQGRSASLLILTVFLLGPIIALVAFCVDVGYIVLTYSQLQNAADAAALAGAQQLQPGYTQYMQLYVLSAAQQAKATQTLSGITTTYTTGTQASPVSAKTAAKTYAGYNSAGGVMISTVNDSDIEFGFTDASGKYNTPAPLYPNTIKVTLRRDSSANGSLNLFFGAALGTSTTDVVRTAAATIYTASVDSFNGTSTANTRILPFTYDVNFWNYFVLTGKSAIDKSDPNDPTDINNSSYGNKGMPQLQIYESQKVTGNFGRLSLDGSHVGAHTADGWITDGVPWDSPGLSDLYAKGLLPLSTHNAESPYPQPDWVGDTGAVADNVKTLNNNDLGQTYLLPLFKPLTPYIPSTAPAGMPVIGFNAAGNQSSYVSGTGNGSHYYFSIYEFVAVTVTDAEQGAKIIKVQPNAYIDPNQVLANITPAGTTSSGSTLNSSSTPTQLTSQSFTTFATPKLTQ